jgi:hypothetical protein
MQDTDSKPKAFSTFRVLNGEAESHERDQLFRNVAQLYAYVSERCDDAQVMQYDEVLCQLADLVEIESRSAVAKVLAPLDRAPGHVVLRLANDVIEVAQPLLAFSSVLSDDDLIDIIASRSEEHRVAIAGRTVVHERVGEAIIEHGASASIGALVRNGGAELGAAARQKLTLLSRDDAALGEALRGRTEIDWQAVHRVIGSVTGRVMESAEHSEAEPTVEVTERVQTLVYNRMRNRAGFSAQEWKVAFNQVKALVDRKQLDDRALTRFVRYGYGHHAGAALSLRLEIGPEVFVKWLAGQDYAALTVALRALNLDAELFEALIGVLPWRDLPTALDRSNVRARFVALNRDDAEAIFEHWRSIAFRKRPTQEMGAVANG